MATNLTLEKVKELYESKQDTAESLLFRAIIKAEYSKEGLFEILKYLIDNGVGLNILESELNLPPIAILLIRYRKESTTHDIKYPGIKHQEKSDLKFLNDDMVMLLIKHGANPYIIPYERFSPDYFGYNGIKSYPSGWLQKAVIMESLTNYIDDAIKNELDYLIVNFNPEYIVLMGRYYTERGMKLLPNLPKDKLNNLDKFMINFIEIGDAVSWLDPDIITITGDTNLMLALSTGDSEGLKYFGYLNIKSINYANILNRTILHYSLSNYDLMSMFLSKGANPTIKDINQLTAFDYTKDERLKNLEGTVYGNPDISFYKQTKRFNNDKLINYLDIFEQYPVKHNILGSGLYGTLIKITDKKGTQFALKIMSKEPWEKEINVGKRIFAYPNCNKNLTCMFDSFMLTIPKENRLPKFINTENTYCILYEMIYGTTLKDIKFDFEEWIKFCLWIIDITNELHANNIYHRDIHEENIMRTLDGRYKLIDLGLSCITETCNDDEDYRYYSRNNNTDIYTFLQKTDTLAVIKVMNETNRYDKDNDKYLQLMEYLKKVNFSYVHGHNIDGIPSLDEIKQKLLLIKI